MLRSLGRLLDSPARRGSQARRARPARPGLEALEARAVMDVSLAGAGLGEWSWGERTAQVSDVQVPGIDGSTQGIVIVGGAVAVPTDVFTEAAHTVDGGTDVVWQEEGSAEALRDAVMVKYAPVSDDYWAGDPAQAADSVGLDAQLIPTDQFSQQR
jgi:hypothetical protein